MTLLNHITDHTPASAGIRKTIGNFLARAGRLVNYMIAALIAQRARQAHLVLLRTLNHRELRDMGIYRCQVEANLAEAAEARSRKQENSRR
jgi:uncharacterized protein YjiS (DUF1127 family)